MVARPFRAVRATAVGAQTGDAKLWNNQVILIYKCKIKKKTQPLCGMLLQHNTELNLVCGFSYYFCKTSLLFLRQVSKPMAIFRNDRSRFCKKKASNEKKEMLPDHEKNLIKLSKAKEMFECRTYIIAKFWQF